MKYSLILRIIGLTCRTYIALNLTHTQLNIQAVINSIQECKLNFF